MSDETLSRENSSNPNSNTAIRKRNKPTLVCTNCKKKKIKCDRKFPCGSCVKMHAGYSCHYEALPKHGLQQNSKRKTLTSQIENALLTEVKRNSPKELDLDEEILRLKSKLSELEDLKAKRQNVKSKPVIEIPTNPIFPNPVVDETDTINLYEGYTPLQMKANIRRINYGPLSWVAIVKKDPGLCLTWKNYCKKNSYSIVNTRLPQFTSEKISTMKKSYEKLKGIDRFFQRRFLDSEGFNEIVPYKSLTKNESVNKNSNQPTFTEISLAKTIFDGRLDPELQLIEKIKRILPKKKVFWVLIDRFFKTLYCFFPFLEERAFRRELVKVFGNYSYEDKEFDTVKIEKKMDLANCAICFILLRMTYLSLFSNRDCVNTSIIESEVDSIDKYLFKNPINMSVIEVANSCIQCFPFTRKSNMTVFQAVLYMRIYRNAAPEEGDGVDGGDSQVSTSLLIQMAYNLGLNREAAKFPEICKDFKTNHLSRKIWCYLCRCDLLLCYTLGHPKTISRKHYDTDLPYVTPENSSIDDLEMETATVDTFIYLEYELSIISKVCDYVLDVNSKVPINKLSTDLHNFEIVLHESFNVVEDARADMSIKSRRPDIVFHYQCTKMRILLSSKTALMTLYHFIYLHYEKQLDSEMSFFYFCKVYQIIVNDLVPQFQEIIYGKYSSMGLLLNPNLQLAIHKANSFNMSCLVRVNYNLRIMESSKSHTSKMENEMEYRNQYFKLKSISQNVLSACDLTTLVLSRIGSRYYYAWRTSKAHAGLIKALSHTDFYDKQSSMLKKIKAFQFTPSQLNECEKLMQALSKKMEKLVHYKDSLDGEVVEPSPINEPTEARIEPQIGNITSTEPNVIPTSGINGSLANESQTPDINYIDKMWLSMVAMKYDSNFDATNNSLGNNASQPSDYLLQTPEDQQTYIHSTSGVRRLLTQQQLQAEAQLQLNANQNLLDSLFYNTEFDLVGDYNLDQLL